MAEKVTGWIFFTVLMSLIPIMIGYVFAFVIGGARWQSINRGDLLLITTTLCAAAMGDLIGSSPTYRSLKIAMGGLTLWVLIMSSSSYAVLLVKPTSSKSERALWLSVSLFGAGLLCSTLCVCFAQLK